MSHNQRDRENKYVPDGTSIVEFMRDPKYDKHYITVIHNRGTQHGFTPKTFFRNDKGLFEVYTTNIDFDGDEPQYRLVNSNIG